MLSSEIVRQERWLSTRSHAIALVGLTHRSILGFPGLHRTVKEAARPHQARRPVRNYCCESDYFRQRPGNLSRANLSGAYLAGADLHEADLRSATLAGALLENTHCPSPISVTPT